MLPKLSEIGSAMDESELDGDSMDDDISRVVVLGNEYFHKITRKSYFNY